MSEFKARPNKDWAPNNATECKKVECCKTKAIEKVKTAKAALWLLEKSGFIIGSSSGRTFVLFSV